MLHSGAMSRSSARSSSRSSLTTIVDIGITALLIYWLFSLIRGTRAVRLVIGVSVLVLVYVLAVAFDLRLLTQILQGGAVVGLFALVVDLPAGAAPRARADRPGRLVRLAPVAGRIARRRARRDRGRPGRRRPVGRRPRRAHRPRARDRARGGRRDRRDDPRRRLGRPAADDLHAAKSPLHDGAVIIRDERIVAAGALLPLAETTIHTERFGTRHRAALGITEQTDAVVVVVSEENGQISLVERARIVRNLTEAGLARAIQGLLDPAGGRRGAFGWRSADQRRGLDGRSPRLRELGRFVGRPPAPAMPQATAVAPTPAAPADPAAADRAPHRRGLRARTDAAPTAAADADRRRARPRRPRPTRTRSCRRGRPGAAVRRILGVIVHNWPLKLAAIGLATLLYGGLVLSQNTQTFTARSRSAYVNQPADTVVLPSTPAPVTRSATSPRPASRSRPARSWRRSTWPASTAKAGVVERPDRRHAVDPRIRVLGYDPAVRDRPARRAQDQGRAGQGRPRRRPRRADARRDDGRPDDRHRLRRRVDRRQVARSGPTSPSSRRGIDVDQDVRSSPSTSSATPSARSTSRRRPPASSIPVFSDRQSRTLPVNPIITGDAGRRLRDRVGHRRPAGRHWSRATPTSWPS